MLRPYIYDTDLSTLRPAARPSAAIAVIPAAVAVVTAPAPTSPVAGSRPAAAVTTTWRTRSATPAPTAAAPLWSGPPGVTIAPPAAPAPPTRAPPIGLARRRLRAVWTVAAIAHPTAVSHRERHSITAVTLHRVALAH